MRNSIRLFRVSGLMVMIAGLSMGNQSCKEAQSARVLKMDVEVGSLDARPVKLPNGETVDFPYVVNALFYRQVMNNDHFVIVGSVPSPTALANAALSKAGQNAKTADEATAQIAKAAGVSATDMRLLKKYGVLSQLQEPARAIYQEMKSGAVGKPTDTSVDDSKLPACLYDLPQAKLAGAMISFEASWGVNASLGYSNSTEISSPSASGSVNFSRSKLELGLRADDPLAGTTSVIADGIAYQSNTKFGISFGGLPLGLGFFFNTPIADVIRKAMDRGLSAMVDQFSAMMSPNKKWDEAWESRVVYDPVVSNGDTHIVFRSGYRAGVQVGDTFTVTNMHYMWEGEPCASLLKYRVPMTATPVAEMEVVSVGDNVSIALVKKYLIEQRIRPGALVKLLAMKPAVPATPVPAKK